MTKKFHITEALAANQVELRAALNSGDDPEFATLLSSVALPRTVVFAGPPLGLQFTHLSAERFLTGDAVVPGHISEIPIGPELAFMLQTEAGAKQGLVAQLRFQRFEVSREVFAARQTTPLITVPTFKNYSLYQGELFEPDDSLGGAVENSTAETGPAAMWTADIINAGCEILRNLGHEALGKQSPPKCS